MRSAAQAERDWTAAQVLPDRCVQLQQGCHLALAMADAASHPPFLSTDLASAGALLGHAFLPFKFGDAKGAL
jgi:hypothetical protein